MNALRLMIYPSVIFCAISFVGAQTYHSDVMVGGVQTLKVEGNVSVEQYSGGFGGDLKIVGDAHVAAGGVALPDMPSGVTGTYHGTHKIGQAVNVGEYLFKKTGDNATGDFVVPLGVIGDWWGAVIKLEIMTGPHDYDSGGAEFTIIPRRISSMGGVIAVDHLAVGGGKGVKIYGKNNGMMHLYLEYDPDHPWGAVRDHEVRVKISTIGSISPAERWHSFAEMTPVQVLKSTTSDGWTGTHVLSGKVVISEPQGDISMGVYE